MQFRSYLNLQYANISDVINSKKYPKITVVACVLYNTQNFA